MGTTGESGRGERYRLSFSLEARAIRRAPMRSKVTPEGADGGSKLGVR